jgi:hypothetical protein
MRDRESIAKAHVRQQCVLFLYFICSVNADMVAEVSSCMQRQPDFIFFYHMLRCVC